MAGIKDVAALAGVSISTVSYVMTGKRPIGANTRRRVLQAARELGYLAKNGGPAPLSGETHFVALSSPVHDFTSCSKLYKNDMRCICIIFLLTPFILSDIFVL